MVGGAVHLVVHSRIVRPLRLQRRPWKVVSVDGERGDTWTLTFEPVGHDGMAFEPGQYVWFTLGDSPLSMQQHPFSMAARQVGASGVSVPTPAVTSRAR